MRFFILRKKGTPLHSNIFERKGILKHIYQFFLRIEWYKRRNPKLKDTEDDYEVVELEMIERKTYEVKNIKEKIDK